MASTRRDFTAPAGKPEVVKVLLVDDHTLVRKAIAELMRSQADLEVVGESGDGKDAVEKARIYAPDVVLIEIKISGCDWVDVIRRIKGAAPDVKIIALTVSEDREDLIHAVRNGVQGYLLKSLEPEELFGAIRNSFRGEAALSPRMASKMLVEFSRSGDGRQQPSSGHLTEREMEVLRLVASGASNGEISAQLRLSKSTVTNHVHNIRKKLRLQSRVQAALYAIDHGFLREGSVSQDSAYELSR